MDEELDKYKDEVVDDFVGEELYDVDYLRIHLKYSGEKQKQMRPGIDEILDLEKISRGNGPFFSISSWRIEFSFLEMLSNVKILKKKFSFSSRNSRF